MSAERVIAFNSIFAALDRDAHEATQAVKQLVHESALKYAKASGWRPPVAGKEATPKPSSSSEPFEDFAMPFGRDKGKLLSTLDVRSLRWWEAVFRRDLEDVTKERYHAKTQKQLDAVRACLRRKGEAASYE